MNPRLQCADAEGRGTIGFLRLWGSKTTVPLRADAILFDKAGKPSTALSVAWRGAFARDLSGEQLLIRGLPTLAFLNEARAVDL